MTDAPRNIAFVGIGKMGLPMSALVTGRTTSSRPFGISNGSPASANRNSEQGGKRAKLQ